jgi:hypothetical protein
MTIKQFNGNWSSVEDRIMFRFNTADGAEYRLWLTRQIAQSLIEGSQHLVVKALEKKHEPKAARAIQEFQQAAIKQRANFRSEYHEAAKLPLGSNPVLVVGLTMKQERDLMSVDFRLITKQNLNMKLTLPMLQGMVLLIDKLQDTARWGIGLPNEEKDDSPGVTLSGETPQSGSGGTLH